jgi:small-conductance mechanosensitive channel
VKKGLSWKPYMRMVMWWFEFLLVLTGYLAVASQLVGKGLEWLIVILFIWLLIYLAGKIILRSDIDK